MWFGNLPAVIARTRNTWEAISRCTKRLVDHVDSIGIPALRDNEPMAGENKDHDSYVIITSLQHAPFGMTTLRPAIAERNSADPFRKEMKTAFGRTYFGKK
jgi:hypothetical protein